MVQKQYKHISVVSYYGDSGLWILTNENGMLGDDDVCLLVFRCELCMMLFLPFGHLSRNIIFSGHNKVVVLCGIVKEIMVVQDVSHIMRFNWTLLCVQLSTASRAGSGDCMFSLWTLDDVVARIARCCSWLSSQVPVKC